MLIAQLKKQRLHLFALQGQLHRARSGAASVYLFCDSAWYRICCKKALLLDVGVNDKGRDGNPPGIQITGMKLTFVKLPGMKKYVSGQKNKE